MKWNGWDGEVIEMKRGAIYFTPKRTYSEWDKSWPICSMVYQEKSVKTYLGHCTLLRSWKPNKIRRKTYFILLDIIECEEDILLFHAKVIKAKITCLEHQANRP